MRHLALSRSTLDRSSHLRADPEFIRKLWADPATRVVPVAAGAAPVRPDGGRVVLATGSGEDWGALWSSAGEPWEPELAEAVFLGVDDDGVQYLTLPVADGLAVPEGARWAGLREVGVELDDTGAGALVTAVAILAWHAVHRRCPRCGHETATTNAGWTRTCPQDGSEHYPRTDPAVIMAVVDQQDRLLLGRQAVWPEHRFSTLAGFVEPGEPLEDAVRREVAEESGVVVGEVRYRGSQPWPFPASLMIGFRGEATTTEITVDGAELAEARWWSREQLVADLASGELLLPPTLSIARRLIEDWYGGPLEADDVWR